ncbi:post-PEP-CTERM-1 domain-containing protein [Lysobacter capsici]|uniref:post-PEP-CTERM-1 domain-containing protein n=1 Tax=Lysobacter capsici TaxID=435897 RepID=UPI000B1D880F
MSTRLKVGLLMPGLLLATCCVAQAAEPSTADVSVSSSKVGIDANGKLRPLTEAESAALDKAASAQQKSAAKTSALRGKFPTNASEVRASERRLPNGAVARKMPLSQMSTLTATRDANGKIVIQHSDPSDGAAPATQQGELPRE